MSTLQVNPSAAVMPESIRSRLRCPICQSTLALQAETAQCTTSAHHAFPIVNEIPVLINEAESIFSIEDFVQQRNTFRTVKSTSAKVKATQLINRLLPNISKNWKGRENYEQFATLLKARSPRPQVLIVGGSVLGQGLEVLLAHSEIEAIASDIAFGSCTDLICDAHTLPFADATFDGVVIQAVLEHVVDPYRCVEEIHRVLKPNGFVYAETPFMQQVHAGAYDFTRFTHLGHRRLFRKFEEVESGAVCGPGMALAWSLRYFLISFTRSKLARQAIDISVRLTAFFLKYFDAWLIERSGAFDAASAYYFIGQRSDRVLSDRSLIQQYRGQIHL